MYSTAHRTTRLGTQHFEMGQLGKRDEEWDRRGPRRMHRAAVALSREAHSTAMCLADIVVHTHHTCLGGWASCCLAAPTLGDGHWGLDWP